MGRFYYSCKGKVIPHVQIIQKARGNSRSKVQPFFISLHFQFHFSLTFAMPICKVDPKPSKILHLEMRTKSSHLRRWKLKKRSVRISIWTTANLLLCAYMLFSAHVFIHVLVPQVHHSSVLYFALLIYSFEWDWKDYLCKSSTSIHRRCWETLIFYQLRYSL